ncbi:MAG TPA: hypothetical protein VGX03_07565 [Candidatus Binatia bacterium]|nr:hypothetical protein [Candidatus Binatia bacterium]
MKPENGNPLTRISLQANGIQGGGAKADGHCKTEHSALTLIRHGLAVAWFGCEALQLLTDDPPPGLVEAADCIEAAADHLSEFWQSLKVYGGGA